MAKALSGQQVLAEAKKFLGDTYVYGADGPNTFDCSGLVEYVFKQLGESVPRTSEAQYAWSRAKPIDQSQLQVGDLVFYEGSSPGHVGFYAGDGKILHAPHTGAVVRYESITGPGNPVGFRRMPNVASGAGAKDIGWTDIPGDIVGGIEGGLGDIAGGLGDVAGSLFSFPNEIINFFKDGTDALEKSLSFFSLLFQPATYIRIGAGMVGLLFLLGAALFLIREAGSAK